MSFTGGLAFAPFDQPIALIIYFYGLFDALYQEGKISKFIKLTFFCNFTFFLSQIYWVAWAFKVYGMPAAMPFALIGMPALLAAFPTICLIPAFYLQKSKSSFGWWSGLGFWISELLRSYLFTGFPWNLSGYVWDINLLQSASLFGIYGLSLLTIVAGTVFFTKQRLCGAIIFSTLLGLWIWGNQRLLTPNAFTPITIRLVQPSIAQENKWKAHHLQANMSVLEVLTQIKGEKPVDITIWPEAAVPACINEIPELQEYLKSCVLEGILITGAPRKESNPEKYFNSVYFIDPYSQVKPIFDKFHLVPFGEYTPLRWLNPFPKLTHGTVDYSCGNGPKTIEIEHLKTTFSPLVCYEVIFSGRATDAHTRPDWMLNITNDAWFGKSSCPFQHLKITQVRAIEEGMPLIRVANNGISAVIDGYGRILQKLDLDIVGYIDSYLPIKLNQTTYKHLVNLFVNNSVNNNTPNML